VVDFRIVSIADPFGKPGLVPLSFALLARAQVMGFLPEEVGGETRLDLRLIEGVAGRLSAVGVAQEQALALRQAAAEQDGEQIELALRRTIEAVDASPQPEGEWEPARELLGDELLARLLGISASSLRRYAVGERTTPDESAWRLHTVARILAALVGSYNGYGVRRWFDRPRRALDGQTPAELVAAAASEEDDRLRAVIDVAASLAGPALAA
jgi:hypothetical protein